MPVSIRELTPRQVSRIVARVRMTEDGCWPWQGFTDRNGYPRISCRIGKRVRGVFPYRTLFELQNGPIEDGLEIDHLCRNRNCCRPDHLESVTHYENMSRAVLYNSTLTKCKRGHPFDSHNTYITPDGRRQCRACRADATRRYQRRRSLAPLSV